MSSFSLDLNSILIILGVINLKEVICLSPSNTPLSSPISAPAPLPAPLGVEIREGEQGGSGEGTRAGEAARVGSSTLPAPLFLFPETGPIELPILSTENLYSNKELYQQKINFNHISALSYSLRSRRLKGV